MLHQGGCNLLRSKESQNNAQRVFCAKKGARKDCDGRKIDIAGFLERNEGNEGTTCAWYRFFSVPKTFSDKKSAFSLPFSPSDLFPEKRACLFVKRREERS